MKVMVIIERVTWRKSFLTKRETGWFMAVLANAHTLLHRAEKNCCTLGKKVREGAQVAVMIVATVPVGVLHWLGECLGVDDDSLRRSYGGDGDYNEAYLSLRSVPWVMQCIRFVWDIGACFVFTFAILCCLIAMCLGLNDKYPNGA